jgi:NitT/TauT family transport system ATP-binding protein
MTTNAVTNAAATNATPTNTAATNRASANTAPADTAASNSTPTDTVHASAGLQLDDVTIKLGGVPIVEALQLDVRAGEILAVVGPSGCGKSTLLRALAGLVPVTAGAIRLDGREIHGPAAERALVFQDDALLPWRSVRRNVELPLLLGGISKADRKELVQALIEQVGLAGFEQHLPRQLSGGMRQRVQLARTLVGSPRVLLMDEPFGALDAQTRSAMQRLLLDVWQQHPTTVVFVTHDVDEALLIADRIAVLTSRPGRLATVFEVERPRIPGGRFEPAFTRSRYEILAALGDHAGAANAGPDGSRPSALFGHHTEGSP